MNFGLVSGLIAIAIVAALALLLRALAGRSGPVTGAADEPVSALPEAHDPMAETATDDDADFGEAVAITSDGWAFLPDGEEVQLVPPGEPEDIMPVRSTSPTGYGPTTDPDIQVLAGRGAPVNPRTGRRLEGWKPGEHLDVGDFVAARVQRGAPGIDPWRLEVLRRDHDYHSFSFETREAAEAALALVSTRIVRPPRGEDGEPMRFEDGHFEAARREYEEIEAELASMPDPDEGSEPRP